MPISPHVSNASIRNFLRTSEGRQLAREHGVKLDERKPARIPVVWPVIKAFARGSIKKPLRRRLISARDAAHFLKLDRRVRDKIVAAGGHEVRILEGRNVIGELFALGGRQNHVIVKHLVAPKGKTVNPKLQRFSEAVARALEFEPRHWNTWRIPVKYAEKDE